MGDCVTAAPALILKQEAATLELALNIYSTTTESRFTGPIAASTNASQ